MAQLKDTTINGNLNVTGKIFQNSNKLIPIVTTGAETLFGTNLSTLYNLQGTPIETLKIATNNVGTSSSNMTRVLYIWTE